MARNKPAGAVLYMDQMLAELASQAPDAVLKGTPSAVHRARVATRRTGAAIQVLRPLAEGHHWKLLGKALKRIRRSVQTLRDLDVMQEHLGDFASEDAYPEACELVRSRLAQERILICQRVAEKAKVEKWLAQTGYWMAIRGSLTSKTEEVAQLIRQALLSQFAEFSSQADRLSEAFVAGDVHHDIEPHALRIAGKSLRYTFEMAQAQHMGSMARVLKRFKQLQDALGVWHDYHVLCARVMKVCENQLDAGEWHVDQRDLILLAAHIHRESAKYLGHFARLWKKHREFLLAQLAVATGEAASPVVAEPLPEPVTPATDASDGSPRT